MPKIRAAANSGPFDDVAGDVVAAATKAGVAIGATSAWTYSVSEATLKPDGMSLSESISPVITEDTEVVEKSAAKPLLSWSTFEGVPMRELKRESRSLGIDISDCFSREAIIERLCQTSSPKTEIGISDLHQQGEGHMTPAASNKLPTSIRSGDSASSPHIACNAVRVLPENDGEINSEMLNQMSTRELRRKCHKYGVDTAGCFDRYDMMSRLLQSQKVLHKGQAERFYGIDAVARPTSSDQGAPKDEQCTWKGMTMRELKQECKRLGVDICGCYDKQSVLACMKQSVWKSGPDQHENDQLPSSDMSASAEKPASVLLHDEEHDCNHETLASISSNIFTCGDEIPAGVAPSQQEGGLVNFDSGSGDLKLNQQLVEEPKQLDTIATGDPSGHCLDNSEVLNCLATSQASKPLPIDLTADEIEKQSSYGEAAEGLSVTSAGETWTAELEPSSAMSSDIGFDEQLRIGPQECAGEWISQEDYMQGSGTESTSYHFMAMRDLRKLCHQYDVDISDCTDKPSVVACLQKALREQSRTDDDSISVDGLPGTASQVSECNQVGPSQWTSMTTRQLRRECAKYGVDVLGCFDKFDMIYGIENAVGASTTENICYLPPKAQESTILEKDLAPNQSAFNTNSEAQVKTPSSDGISYQADLHNFSMRELRKIAEERGVSLLGAYSKADVINRLEAANPFTLQTCDDASQDPGVTTVHTNQSASQNLEVMSVRQLKKQCEMRSLCVSGCFSKADLIQVLQNHYVDMNFQGEKCEPSLANTSTVQLGFETSQDPLTPPISRHDELNSLAKSEGAHLHDSDLCQQGGKPSCDARFDTAGQAEGLQDNCSIDQENLQFEEQSRTVGNSPEPAMPDDAQQEFVLRPPSNSETEVSQAGTDTMSDEKVADTIHGNFEDTLSAGINLDLRFNTVNLGDHKVHLVSEVRSTSIESEEFPYEKHIKQSSDNSDVIWGSLSDSELASECEARGLQFDDNLHKADIISKLKECLNRSASNETTAVPEFAFLRSETSSVRATDDEFGDIPEFPVDKTMDWYSMDSGHEQGELTSQMEWTSDWDMEDFSRKHETYKMDDGSSDTIEVTEALDADVSNDDGLPFQVCSDIASDSVFRQHQVPHEDHLGHAKDFDQDRQTSPSKASEDQTSHYHDIYKEPEQVSVLLGTSAADTPKQPEYLSNFGMTESSETTPPNNVTADVCEQFDDYGTTSKGHEDIHNAGQQDFHAMTMRELRALCSECDIDISSCLNKAAVIDKLSMTASIDQVPAQVLTNLCPTHEDARIQNEIEHHSSDDRAQSITDKSWETASMRELRAECVARDLDISACFNKSDFIEKLQANSGIGQSVDAASPSGKNSTDEIATIWKESQESTQEQPSDKNEAMESEGNIRINDASLDMNSEGHNTNFEKTVGDPTIETKDNAATKDTFSKQDTALENSSSTPPSEEHKSHDMKSTCCSTFEHDVQTQATWLECREHRPGSASNVERATYVQQEPYQAGHQHKKTDDSCYDPSPRDLKNDESHSKPALTHICHQPSKNTCSISKCSWERMTMRELRLACTSQGIDPTGLTSKVDVIALLRSREAAARTDEQSTAPEVIGTPGQGDHHSAVEKERAAKTQVLQAMSAKELRDECKLHNVDLSGCLDRDDIISRVLLAVGLDTNTNQHDDQTPSALHTSQGKEPLAEVIDTSAPGNHCSDADTTRAAKLQALQAMSAKQLRNEAKLHNVNLSECLDSDDVVNHILAAIGLTTSSTQQKTSSSSAFDGQEMQQQASIPARRSPIAELYKMSLEELHERCIKDGLPVKEGEPKSLLVTKLRQQFMKVPLFVSHSGEKSPASPLAHTGDGSESDQVSNEAQPASSASSGECTEKELRGQLSNESTSTKSGEHSSAPSTPSSDDLLSPISPPNSSEHSPASASAPEPAPASQPAPAPALAPISTPVPIPAPASTTQTPLLATSQERPSTTPLEPAHRPVPASPPSTAASLETPSTPPATVPSTSCNLGDTGSGKTKLKQQGPTLNLKNTLPQAMSSSGKANHDACSGIEPNSVSSQAPASPSQDLAKCSVKQLISIAQEKGIDVADCVEKQDIIERVRRGPVAKAKQSAAPTKGGFAISRTSSRAPSNARTSSRSSTQVDHKSSAQQKVYEMPGARKKGSSRNRSASTSAAPTAPGPRQASHGSIHGGSSPSAYGQLTKASVESRVQTVDKQKSTPEPEKDLWDQSPSASLAWSDRIAAYFEDYPGFVSELPPEAELWTDAELQIYFGSNGSIWPSGKRPSWYEKSNPNRAQEAPKLPRERRYPDLKEHFEILGMPENIEHDMIKRMYRQLARESHPDKHPEDEEAAKQKFQQIQAAYEAIAQRLHL